MSVRRVTIAANDHGGSQIPTLQVVHDIECPLSNGYAEATARMFARVTGKSAHKCIGPDTVVTCLPLTTIAWHVGPNGNRGSIGYEQTGYARFTRAEWIASGVTAQINNLAVEVVADAKRYGIPNRQLSDAQLATWARNGRRAVDGGRVTHAQIARVLGGTDHADPGTGYPLDLLDAAVTRVWTGQAPLTLEDWMTTPISDANAAKIAAAVWAEPLTGELNAPEPAGAQLVRARLGWALIRDQLPGVSARAVSILAGVSELLGRDPADVDEAALATALAPLLTPETVATLSSDTLTAIAAAVNDEQARRLAPEPAPIP